MVFCLLRSLGMQKAGDLPVEEEVGFEPTVPFRTFAFKANAIDRSAISPRWSPKSDLNRRPPTYKEGALPLSYSGIQVLYVNA